MLRIVDRFWGGARHLHGDPQAEAHQDAVCIPFDRSKYIADDHIWGIFSADGSPIEAALYRRGDPAQQVSGGKSFNGLPLDRADPNFNYVYLGPFMQHYGHFITATLARGWYPFRNPSKHTKYVLHSEDAIDRVFSYSYAATCLERIGLHRDNVVRFTTPTRIDELIVPQPAFEEQHFERDLFGDMCRHIGAPFRAEQRSSQPLYLSKQRLPAGVGKFINEDILVRHFDVEGFLIVYPELLSLPQQIELFNRHAYVVGSGSGLHTSVFCATPPELFSLSLSEGVNSNFLLVDRVSKTTTVHLLPKAGTRWQHYPDHIDFFISFMRSPETFPERAPGDSVGGFMSSAEIIEPDQFASDIVALLRSRGAFS